MGKYFVCTGCKHEIEVRHTHFKVTKMLKGEIIARYCTRCWEVVRESHLSLVGDD